MPKILLIEDNPGDVTLIKELLKSSGNLTDKFIVIHAARVSDALDILRNTGDMEVILSDISLPDSTGQETLARLLKVASHLPIVFMTGVKDEVLASLAINDGAQDYLVKGNFNGEVLARSLEYSIGRKRAQNEMNEILVEVQENKQRIDILALEKRQLIKLNQSKDEFISIASHQLRTPATAVKQCLSMILGGYFGEVPERQLRHLNNAYISNERELHVIDELLKTAQLDAANIKLDKQLVNVSEVLTEVVESMGPMLLSRNQKITTEFDPDMKLTIDCNEFKLMIENVIENASKYSPHDTTINIVARVKDKKNVIEVTDQGVGIDKKDQQKIFEKFTRVDNEVSDTVTGTGLGLYWVKRIAKLHAGNVVLQSSPGAGSTFSLRFPL